MQEKYFLLKILLLFKGMKLRFIISKRSIPVFFRTTGGEKPAEEELKTLINKSDQHGTSTELILAVRAINIFLSLLFVLSRLLNI